MYWPQCTVWTQFDAPIERKNANALRWNLQIQIGIGIQLRNLKTSRNHQIKELISINDTPIEKNKGYLKASLSSTWWFMKLNALNLGIQTLLHDDFEFEKCLYFAILCQIQIENDAPNRNLEYAMVKCMFDPPATMKKTNRRKTKANKNGTRQIVKCNEDYFAWHNLS